MLNFEEKFIPDEKERLIFLLKEYIPFLVKHATTASLKNHKLILKLLEEKTPHTDLLKKIEPIFATEDGTPKPLTLSDEMVKKLGPNRSAEYLGLHADLSYMVTQNMSNVE